jgi:hypothetical protein
MGSGTGNIMQKFEKVEINGKQVQRIKLYGRANGFYSETSC